ncbi:uncharacterized protein [Odocoileus virginianus]|uniref:Uncharacterized protein isoform X2 n=1 Tax=Odocoileus virginianus TaxID=9874 RepID=A0A6J0X8E7_ODOVR
MDSCSTLAPLEPVSSWEEDRKFVLRAWCLVFIVLATMMLLSVLDGRMAYLYGSYTGYVGFWTNCRKHMCADLHQVTGFLCAGPSGKLCCIAAEGLSAASRVPFCFSCKQPWRKEILIHMSMGFMILAMILSLVLLFAMGFSFRPALRRLNKTDLVFSTLGSFTANCEMLQPRPHVSYLVTTYLSWGAGALMLWAGILSYLNYMGMWGKGTPSMERRMSYRRWASLQSTRKSISEPPSDAGSKHTEDLSV